MIEIHFKVPRRQDGDVIWDVVAALRVEGTSMELEGDQDFAEVRDIEVLDVESGQTVSFDRDPERWARNLPQAFRSGDLVCTVIHDSSPGAARHARVAAEA